MLRQPAWLMPLALSVALVVGLSLLPTLALAKPPAIDDGTGAALLQRCQDTAVDAIYCMGMLRGLRDFHDHNVYAGSNQVFCMPRGVTLGQIQLVVIRYLQMHPERLHYTWTALTVEALTQAFPCR